MDETVKLGPFELGPRIGEGGMGAVYRARHVVTEVDVALKVLPHGGDQSARRRFHREIQAQAELTHPGVVYLFEYGTVGPEAADLHDGLEAGSPYVAMELADRGTLQDQRPLDGWDQVRTVLLQVLDALAFAHARDVIHRDLKPENFLVFDGEWSADAHPMTVKLADFGLAHPFEDERDRDLESLRATAGTPFYMPPEQSRGNWREYGPWTDLYALGCITWELVCGQPPFSGQNPLAVVLQHEDGDRPPLDPQFPVPEGLEHWIHRAMAVDPSARFRRAADAARTLPDFPRDRSTADGGRSAAEPSPEKTTDSEEGSTLTGAPNRDLAPTVAPTLAETFQLEATASLDETLPPGDRPDGSATDGAPEEPSELDATPAPSLPDDWRKAHTARIPAPLVGTGLGLFALRNVPLVDRDTERDRLWDSLRSVVDDGAMQIVVLEGESGAGKSRLAEWIATRAHELGAATPLQARHTEGGEGRAEGLAGMIRRFFHTWKMDRGEAYEFLRDHLPPLDDESLREPDARALTEFLYPTDDEAEAVDGPQYRLASAAQRHALVTRLLARVAHHRPPVVWLDDLQWSAEGLSYLDHLVSEAPDPPPALIIATVRSDMLDDRPGLRDRLAPVRADDRSRRLELGPLDRTHQRELIERLLPLNDDLADLLADRTEGNPLFATQLLGHWVDREAIEVRPEGFALADDSDAAIPEDIQTLWMDRIDRLLEGYPAGLAVDALQALELAAALGREVDDAEWRAICEEAGVAIPTGLVDQIVASGLAHRTREGWAFGHGLLVDSLDQRAREADRRRNHNRHCARVLQQRLRHNQPEAADRLADHWIAAGEPARALAPLRTRAERLNEIGDLEASRTTLKRRERVLDAIGIGDRDPRRIRNEIEQAVRDIRAARDLASLSDRLDDDLLERARSTGAPELVCLALCARGNYRKSQGRFAEARRSYDRALDVPVDPDRRDSKHKALLFSGWLALKRGNLDRANRDFSRVSDPAAEASRFRRLQAERGLTGTLSAAGYTDRVRTKAERLLAQVRELGYRSIEAAVSNTLGELHRFGGESDTARRYYRDYISITRELGRFKDLAIARMNLALLDLSDRRFASAERRLDEAEHTLQGRGLAERSDLFDVARLTLAAGTEDWSAFDRTFAPYRDGWPEEARLIQDHPWLLEIAGDYADEAGERDRARRLWQLARDLSQRLDNPEPVERVESKLDGAD